MRHLRHLVLAALAVAMCTAPVASAHAQRTGGGHLVPPNARVDGLTAGDVMGEAWYRNLALPVAENPLFGNGDQSEIQRVIIWRDGAEPAGRG
jgi:hypothetical protein